MSKLSFSTLRAANKQRLPLFKNKHGQLAHSKPDGSDWTPAQWFQALVGELGEWAEVRLQYERGEISREDYEVKCAKELADVQTYLDLLANRALDGPTTHMAQAPTLLLSVMKAVGLYANSRKKFERGDNPKVDTSHLNDAIEDLLELSVASTQYITLKDSVMFTHPEGVDLAKATIDKFNEVGNRFDCTVFLNHDDGVVTKS